MRFGINGQEYGLLREYHNLCSVHSKLLEKIVREKTMLGIKRIKMQIRLYLGCCLFFDFLGFCFLQSTFLSTVLTKIVNLENKNRDLGIIFRNIIDTKKTFFFFLFFSANAEIIFTAEANVASDKKHFLLKH